MIVCSNVNIDQLILESKVIEEQLGRALKDEYHHDWTCDPRAREKIDKLQTYRYYLEQEQRKLMMGGEGCLSSDELQLLYEKIKSITANCEEFETRPDLIIDSSGVDVWIALNPYCVAREKWEYLAYDILCDLSLDVQILKEEYLCDITTDIITEIIPCDLVVMFDIYNKNCELGFTPTIDIKKCVLNYEALMTNKDCELGLSLHLSEMTQELEFDVYAEFMNQGLSPVMVESIYAKGLSLSIDNEELYIHTKDQKYGISSIQFSDDPNIESLAKYGVNPEDSEYLKDPELFINNLNKYYGDKQS